MTFQANPKGELLDPLGRVITHNLISATPWPESVSPQSGGAVKWLMRHENWLEVGTEFVPPEMRRIAISIQNHQQGSHTMPRN